MNILEMIASATREVTIMGSLPLGEDLVRGPESVLESMRRNENLTLRMLYECDNDLFYQSLSTDIRSAHNRLSYAKLRDRRDRVARLRDVILKLAGQGDDGPLADRLVFSQVNLHLLVNIVRCDGRLLFCPVLNEVPPFGAYHDVDVGSDWHELLSDCLESYSDPDRGGVYQSGHDDEMLVMYDKGMIPRGIFPRSAFYNPDFQRYSVWLFVFNRRGQLLLHKRGPLAKDNRDLWDKSAGGHVDITDRSAAATAERELIEELYLEKAEDTKYVQERTKDVVNLGVWSPVKRGHERALSDIKDMGKDDWAYFYLPRTISRTSRRRLYRSKDRAEVPMIKETKFISDAFLFVAPESGLMTSEHLNQLSKAAGKEHKLMFIPEIVSWIEEEKAKNTETSVFTDDLLYIMDYMRDTLEGFSEMVKFTFCT